MHSHPGGRSVAGGNKSTDASAHLGWVTLAICMHTTVALLSALCVSKWQRKMLKSQKPSKPLPPELLLPETGQEV